MCGITGIFGFKNIEFEKKIEILDLMTQTLNHRGPDSSGNWFDSEGLCFLGHKRLAILDLSPAGRQPMLSSSKRYAISYNGEIYNHLQLRKRIPNIQFKGTSDTETLINLIEQLGLKQTLTLIKGQFAFALYDLKFKELYLCRDRLGEKPLYYYFEKQGLVFGSELKALKQFKSLDFSLDNNSIHEFIHYSYISAPNSIYRNVKKVEPGHLVKFYQEKDTFFLKPESYWDIDELIGKEPKQFGTFQESATKLHERLVESVRLQMISDVEIGTFLSGGIDSSLITAILAQESSTPINTFTVGFNQAGFNEAPYARKIADYLKTNHTEVFVTESDLLDIIPQLPTMYDEPFADSSQIPTALISSLAKDNVTVILSGDGADELFGGYNRYRYVPKIWRYVSMISPSMRRLSLDFLMNILLLKTKSSPLISKLQKLSFSLYKSESINDFYENIQRTYNSLDCPLLVSPHGDSTISTDEKNFLNFMMREDLKRYLPGDILCKVDRASMYSSLEVRAPYLDKDVVEYAAQLPESYKINNSNQKLILKQVLYSCLPESFFRRPKAGFAIPLDNWLMGPLKQYTYDLLNPDTIKAQGFLNHNVVSSVKNQYYNSNKISTSTLWNLLMFQSWLNVNNK